MAAFELWANTLPKKRQCRRILKDLWKINSRISGTHYREKRFSVLLTRRRYPERSITRVSWSFRNYIVSQACGVLGDGWSECTCSRSGVWFVHSNGGLPKNIATHWTSGSRSGFREAVRRISPVQNARPSNSSFSGMLNPADYALLQKSPASYAAIERSFSKLRKLLQKDRSFADENLTSYVAPQVNNEWKFE